MAGKNKETRFFYNKTPPVFNLSQQDYANSPCILGGRKNQTDVSNTSNIFTPMSAPVNLEEDRQDFNEAVEKI